MATINYSLQFLYDTAAVISELNPVLLEGQVGIENDTKLFKIGDGTTAWNEMSYAVLNNNQSVWINRSAQVGNQLVRSELDGGLYVPRDPSSDVTNATANGKTDRSKVVYDISAEAGYDSEAKRIAYRTSWLISRIIVAMGPKFESLLSMTAPGTGADPYTINKLIAELVTSAIDAIPSNRFGAQINDNATNQTNVWSSQKINETLNSVVNQRFQELIGAAPAELDTIYELAAVVANNKDLLGGIVEEMATAVRHTPQSLTSEQANQVRSNIGAASSAFVGSFNNANDFPNSTNLTIRMATKLTEPHSTTPFFLPAFC